MQLQARISHEGPSEDREPLAVSQATTEGSHSVFELSPTAGDRLDRGLAMDQRLREARTRVMQRRINGAHRLEVRAQQACVWAGLGTLVLWFVLLIPVAPSFSDALPLEVLRALAVVFSVAIGLSLPVGAAVAISAGQWRKHLLRSAFAQHLTVQDPGWIDYP